MKVKLTKQGEEVFEVVRNFSSNQIGAIQSIAYERVTEENFEAVTALPLHTLQELRNKGIARLEP